MRELGRDVVYGLRSFLQKPGFTAAALASLMVGIGTTTAIFTLYQSVFVHPLPLDDLDRLVKMARLTRNDSGEYVGEQSISYPNYRDYVERSRSFDGLGIYHWWPMYLTGGSDPERVTGMFVSGNYFEILGVDAAQGQGRLLRPEDSEKTSEPVAVLTHGAWQRLFGAEPVVGRTVQVNGESLTVVGVSAKGFRGTELQASVDIFMPITTFERISPYGVYFENRGAGLFPSIGRLRDGVSQAQAGQEMMGIARQLAEEYPETLADLGAKVVSLADSTIRPADRDRYRAYGSRSLIVVLILMIACLSVANLLFVRGAERARELALRRALGAGQGRIFRQLLTENLLLFLIGGVLSLVVAKIFLHVLWRFRPPEMPESALDLRLGIIVWGFALLAATVSGLVFGLLPALRASRTDLVAHLKESEPLQGRGLPRLLKPRSLVVALQVALALVALIGAGLLLRSLQQTLEIDLGFRSEQIAVLTVAPGDQGYEPARIRDFYRQLLERAHALPGVKAAGYSQNRLLRGAPMQRQVYLPGNETASEIGARNFHRVNTVSPEFFDTAGIEIDDVVRFQQSKPEERLVVIVNETMAEHLWAGQNPIGQRFNFDYPSDNPQTTPVEVVGVAADARYREVHEEKQFFVYLPLNQNLAPSMALHVRTEGDPGTVLPALRKSAQELDPGLALTDVGTMRSFVREALWLERASTSLLGLFGGLALLLALVGVYGLLAYTVRSRRREIGILIALGAGRGHVLKTVLFEALQVVIFGIGIGLIMAFFFLGPILENQLYQVSTTDLSIYMICPLALLLAAVLGSLLPAWRAARTNPNETLRAE